MYLPNPGFFLHIIHWSALLDCPDFCKGVVFNVCFYMRFDLVVDICIRTWGHDGYMYISSALPLVALLGLHEIVGGVIFFLKKKKKPHFYPVQSAGTTPSILPVSPFLSGCQGAIDFD